ncbi:AfsA-related hotdog domain-containing protein [Streptomyces castrisilvae]|uniref:AfsA-related hotdog domain-containing protein n=1 Tax=Streptomyces castrisilvae TaxID=3033811 RepID=A0ABY9HLR4_9ACTN|nr:AfsA-related hotdog domain-containing protein [Streptomyces sp. Mut1]WLQ35069.1 AfsA-related hotdog domain-containing protein [Streptomyces sp. Mut1]
MTVDNGTTSAPAIHGLASGAGSTGVAQHLIHRPAARSYYGLDAPSPGEEFFTLVGETPVAHPLLNDGPGRFHDLQIATGSVRDVGELVGHRYFGVPGDRPGLFYRFALDLTDLSAWRTDPGGRGVVMETRIRARPANVVAEVPRGLDFHLDVVIDGRPCAVGSAGMVFLMPKLYRKHVAHARQAMRAVPELNDAPDGPPRPADPAEVGRRAGRNVVVSEPVDASRGRISSWVLSERVSPVFDTTDERQRGQFSGLHLLEALRQGSLLAAGRAHGLDAERSTLEGCQVHFRGQAERALPLRCVAVAGPLGRDADGRPSVPVTLTLTQQRWAVAEARTCVVQDY